MKRIVAIFLTVFLLAGCSEQNQIDDVLAFRKRLISTETSLMNVDITADYGDSIYSFSVDCKFDITGAMTFAVLEPETIAGITGSVDARKGAFTFDDQVLLFELLAEGQLSPISAPWIVMNALRSGYIQSCGKDGEYLKVIIDDSFASEALQVIVWFADDMVPVAADISWQNRRILSVQIDSFSYM